MTTSRRSQRYYSLKHFELPVAQEPLADAILCIAACAQPPLGDAPVTPGDIDIASPDPTGPLTVAGAWW